MVAEILVDEAEFADEPVTIPDSVTEAAAEKQRTTHRGRPARKLSDPEPEATPPKTTPSETQPEKDRPETEVATSPSAVEKSSDSDDRSESESKPKKKRRGRRGRRNRSKNQGKQSGGS